MIKYVTGDATYPIDTRKLENTTTTTSETKETKEIEENEKEFKVIIHVCNDINRWGKGFVLAVSKRWPEAAKVYHKMEMKLGKIRLIF